MASLLDDSSVWLVSVFIFSFGFQVFRELEVEGGCPSTLLAF